MFSWCLGNKVRVLYKELQARSNDTARHPWQSSLFCTFPILVCDLIYFSRLLNLFTNSAMHDALCVLLLIVEIFLKNSILRAGWLSAWRKIFLWRRRKPPPHCIRTTWWQERCLSGRNSRRCWKETREKTRRPGSTQIHNQPLKLWDHTVASPRNKLIHRTRAYLD